MTPHSTHTRLVALAFTLAVLVHQVAHAAAPISGGVDIEDSIGTGGTWVMLIGGGLCILALLVTGLRMAFQGRQAAGDFGWAVGGTLIFFGAPYILSKFGITSPYGF